jgi:hypothetical protein
MSTEADLQTHKTALQVFEQSALEHQATITSLQANLEAADAKHDELLLESARMSDSRIAELAEQVEQANSLKNEAVAELEHERAGGLDTKNREEQLTMRADRATSEAQKKQEVSIGVELG